MAKRSSNSTQTVSLGNMDEVEKVFKKFDANGDGKISVSELRAILKALGTDTSPDELQRIMSEIDKDGDGFIDLKEFTDFHRGGSDGDGSSTKELREAFDLYDRDKNGLISASELHAVLKSLGEKCTLKDCSRMISSVDVDGDGSVNFEEFKKMMTRA
uniref:Putative calcium-binding protein CML18 n=1 Tax=Davidia involucrata TaxID=16924 RepID=A0A5B7BEG3_DAVIN